MYGATAPEEFLFKKCLTASAVSHPPGCLSCVQSIYTYIYTDMYIYIHIIIWPIIYIYTSFRRVTSQHVYHVSSLSIHIYIYNIYIYTIYIYIQYIYNIHTYSNLHCLEYECSIASFIAQGFRAFRFASWGPREAESGREIRLHPVRKCIEYGVKCRVLPTWLVNSDG